MKTIRIPFDERRSATAIVVAADSPPALALAALSLPACHGTIVVHGGASST